MTRRTIAAVVTIGSIVVACGGSGGSDPSAADPVSSAARAERSGSFILGVVRDSRSEAPIAGVVVAAAGHSTTTASDGTYRLSLSA